jgi:hypothetical protein
MKNRMQESAGLVVRVRLSPSMAAWPGSVIEDDLVRKSEGQRMQATVPARHGMAAASQPATPTWRRLYRLVPRGLAPIHPAGSHIATGRQPAAHHVSPPYPSRVQLFHFYKFVPFGLFFFSN